PLCAAAAFGAENNDENAAREGLWNNLHVYRAFNQRGGPYLTDDSYLEWEFGGRAQRGGTAQQGFAHGKSLPGVG
ncbi:hypothetical protein ACV34M_31390, partial [Pseudomonas aeruginosa]